MTLAITKVPQVYLYGVIDADAPQRFEALVRSGKIPRGSDIYLSSPSGDLRAGLALGRLFRAGAMVTHLGTPRRSLRSGYANKTAFCVDACTYAYFGGLYRWAPTGFDRIGLSPHSAMDPKAGDTAQAQQTSNDVASYLTDMDVDLGEFTPTLTTSHDAVVWLTADQMTANGLANNGRLPLTAKTVLLPPMPTLELNQDDRHGSHRLVLQCRPGNVTLTAYDFVGKTRAREIVSHATRSYFEVNQQEVLTEQHDGVSVVDDAVVITRPYPSTELVDLLSAHTIGAWAGGRTSAFRYGFTIKLYPARDAIKDYYNACWRAAPWPARQKAAKAG
ncbi:hypothetical protein [Rhodanobacter sp. C03]|uniref:hypothetical protein n=1 Tax=Rhodanobacter sp. C03 TaxID=1945858 RepID=UPI0020C3470F|nr:hypothetical protein [Rhodanobacter sp. C03]